MDKTVSIAKNIFFNGTVQVTSILLNIILLPYITGIFDANTLGINSFGQAIAGYFVLFGNLGITIYGVRTIAETKHSDDLCQLSFSRCISYQFFFNLIAFIAYNVWAYYRHDSIYYLFNLIILTSMTDLSWAYTGKERFDLVAIRNLVIKIIGTSLIFIFIKESDQLPLYIIIQQGVLLISNIVFWVELRKINLRPRFSNIYDSLRFTFTPAIAVFLPSVFSSVYLSLNKVMLGYMSTLNEVAIYDYPNRLVRIAITLVGVFGTVLMPRLAYLKSTSDFTEFRKKVKQLMFVSLICSVPIMYLFVLLSAPLCNIFFSSTLAKADIVLSIVSPVVMTSGLSLYLIYVSINRMKILTTSIATAGIFNMLINFLLIPSLGAIGAAISSLMTELLVNLILIYFVRDFINLKWFLYKMLTVITIGTIAYALVNILINKSNFNNDYIECIISSIGYATVFYALSFFFLHRDMEIIYRRIKK